MGTNNRRPIGSRCHACDLCECGKRICTDCADLTAECCEVAS